MSMTNDAGAPRSDEDALLDHLRNDPTVAAIAGLKDLHLRQLVKAGKRTAAELSSGTAPVVSRNAGLIATSISEYLQDSTAGSGPAAAAPPVRPEPPAREAPEAEAVPPTAAPAPVPAPAVELDPDGFEPCVEFPDPDAPIEELKVSVRQDGTVSVTWAPDFPGAVYRLVSEDEYAPFSPDDSRLVAVVQATSAEDVVPFAHVVRHYALWRNTGATVAEAKRNQPTLVARAVVVAPVMNVAIAEDSGQVVGHWSAAEGTAAVHVYRTPRELMRGAVQPQFRIAQDRKNLAGFVDPDARRGKRYVYQVLAEAVVDGVTRLSTQRSVTVEVSSKLEPVSDLELALHEEGEALRVDLTWSPPAGGTVIVYRTREAPVPGLDREPIPETSLESQARLPQADRLNQPVETEGVVAQMRDVPWPDGWARAHFTPVVLLDGKAFVGRTRTQATVRAPKKVRIVERVTRQLLTFDWPSGADAMQVFQSAKGVDSSIALQGEPFEISRDDYLEYGGFEPGPEPLPRDGCDLHLVSVLFDSGRKVQSAATVVRYDWIRRLHYSSNLKRSFTGKVSGAEIAIESRETDMESPPPFVLVYHPDRLPLSKTDGEVLAMVQDSDAPGQPAVQIRPRSLGKGGASGWRTDPASWQRVVKASKGFIRLFADVEPERARHVALMDPPLAGLRLRTLSESLGVTLGGR